MAHFQHVFGSFFFCEWPEEQQRRREQLNQTGLLRLEIQASAKLSIYMMEVSIKNQRSQPANTCARKKATFHGAEGGGASFNLNGVDFKNPYKSNPIIDCSRRKVRGSRGSQRHRGREEEECVNIEPSVCP